MPFPDPMMVENDFQYLRLGESKTSSSLGTKSSASLPLMEESSLTSTLCTSRASTGAPRQDSAAMVNWISLLFSQCRTKLLWLLFEMESSEDSRGISLKAFTAAAMWNCKEDESWYLSRGSVDGSSFVWDFFGCWDKCHRHLWWFFVGWESKSLWSPCLIDSHQMRQTLSVQDVMRQLATVELINKSDDKHKLNTNYRDLKILNFSLQFRHPTLKFCLPEAVMCVSNFFCFKTILSLVNGLTAPLLIEQVSMKSYLPECKNYLPLDNNQNGLFLALYFKKKTAIKMEVRW